MTPETSEASQAAPALPYHIPGSCLCALTGTGSMGLQGGVDWLFPAGHLWVSVGGTDLRFTPFLGTQ